MAVPEPVTRLEQYWKAILDKIEGGSAPSVTIEPLIIMANGAWNEQGKAYWPVVANIPKVNEADLGKVVVSYENEEGITEYKLINQNAGRTIGENGTYDTTTDKMVTVTVPPAGVSVTISGHGATPVAIPSEVEGFFDTVNLDYVSVVRVTLGTQSATAVVQSASSSVITFRGVVGVNNVTEATFANNERTVYPTALSIGGTDYTAFIPNIDWTIVVYFK